jgi:hypothetical protein
MQKEGEAPFFFCAPRISRKKRKIGGKWGVQTPQKQFGGEKESNAKPSERRVGKCALFIILQNMVDEAGKSL